MSIELIQFPGLRRDTSLSPPCWKVHLALRLKGLEYKSINIGTPAEAKKYNPRGRVPAAKIQGTMVVDSSDILTALDETYPETSLAPASAYDRAMTRILEDWADESVYFLLVYNRWLVPENRKRLMNASFRKRFPGFLLPVVEWYARREVAGRARGQGVGLKDPATVKRELAGCFQAIEDMLADGREFLLGASIGRADIAVYSHFDHALIPSLAPDVDHLRKFERVMAWCRRVAAKTDSMEEFRAETPAERRADLG